jgi:tetratricopeptide (TPR) repeat protein
MAYTSEIEKLERRIGENPQGRLFAPLADAYRKLGEVARAMELLQDGLARHPDYIGAHIVLGRCHLDLGQDDEATGSFGHVLDLDGENVIALKALAEIDERGGRVAEAKTRLERLLEIDRGNEDAAQQLARLVTLPEIPAADPAPEPATDLGLEPVPVPGDEAGAEAPAPPEGILLTNHFGAAALADEAAAPPVADLEVIEAEVDDGTAGEAVEGLEPAAFAAAEPAEFEPVELEAEDFDFERETDIQLEGSAENEFQSRSDAERLAADPERPGPNPWQTFDSGLAAEPVEPPAIVDWEGDSVDSVDAAPGEADADAGVEAVEAAAPAAADAVDPVTTPAPEPEDAGEPELVVTETMATVYERQGLRLEALRVYRELVSRRPEDARLTAKVAELESLEVAEPPPPPRSSLAAADTGGESAGAFLRGILGARLSGPGRPGAAQRPELEAVGFDAAPTRPAADPVSLSAVFGDELPPATPAASQPAQSPGQGFSFDAFFGGGVQPHREGGRPSAAGEEDLEQFHAWLQGLKK